MNDPTIRTTPTWLDGLWVTLFGIPDLWLVLDAPRCVAELIVETGAEEHAWRQRLLQLDGRDRVFVTSLALSKLDTGETSRMVERIATLCREGDRPGAVLVSDMAPSRLIGSDLNDLARQVAKASNTKTCVVENLSLTRDWLDAIVAAQVALVDAIPETAFSKRNDSVAIVGLVVDRAEADALGDVAEIRRLLAGIGFYNVIVWASGCGMEHLAAAGSCRWIIALPYGVAAAEKIAQRSGAEVFRLDLPIGLDGTIRFMRELGRWLGRERQAESFISSALSFVVPKLAPFVPTLFAGSKIGIVADPVLARGLGSWLAEMGVCVIGPIFRCRREDWLTSDEKSTDGIRRYDPSIESLTSWVMNESESGPFDLIIGSTREREALRKIRVPFLELGYPSVNYRPVCDSPRIGFSGALHLAERIANCLAEIRFERASSGQV